MTDHALRVEFSLMHGGARQPIKFHVTDAAWDMYASEHTVLPPYQVTRVVTGVKLAIPRGWCGRLLTRSGYAANGLFVQAGVIDSGYRGEIVVLIYNAATADQYIAPGDRCAQLTFERVPDVVFSQVDELSPTTRGDGGFGSTGQ